jgi:hypothetical protein
MNIKKESLYMIEGHDLSVISRVLTAINSMSGQRLAGKGDDLRDLVQKAQGSLDAAIEADSGELSTADAA